MITPESEIVIEYLKKYRTATSSSIADVLYRDHPSIFQSKEHARNRVRWYRGTRKGGHGDCVSSEYLVPRNIPEPEYERFGIYELSGDVYPVIIGADAHIPYHDRDALEIFIDRAVEINAKTIILDGDWIDMYQLSRFARDPRYRSVKEEIATFRLVMEELRSACPNAKILYKLGNHEERYFIYLANQAPEIFDLTSFSLENVLKTKEFGIEIIGDKRVIKIGSLHVIHGHEYSGGATSPVNPARGLFLKARKNAIMAHCHKSSEHPGTTIDGDVFSCWSIGSLCQLHPQYCVLNDWNLGFAEVYEEDDGMFRVDNRKIIQYRLV